MVHINILAIIIAAIVYMVIGTLWYSPVLFAKQWMQLVGRKKDELKQSGAMYIVPFIYALIIAVVISEVFYSMNVRSLVEVFQIIILIWVGFVLATMGVNYFFEKRHIKLLLINAFYHLATMLGMGIVIYLIK